MKNTFWIKLLVAVVFSLLVYFLRGNAMEKLGIVYFYKPIYIIDAISVVGFIYLFFGLLIFVSQQGVFDAATYGLKKLFKAIRIFGDINIEDSYFDYVRAKEEKGKIDFFAFIVIGIVMVAIGFILTFIYDLY